MKIENQFCTLEQAKKLKELGIGQNSFVYSDWDGRLYVQFDGDNKLRLYDRTIHNGTTVGEFFSMFTVAELGEMLPYATFVQGARNVSEFRSGKINPSAIGRNGTSGRFTISSDYSSVVETSPSGYDCYETWKSINGETEAECRAAMLIHLLEQKLISAEEVGKEINPVKVAG